MNVKRGDTVEAFHPRMFGVVKTGIVVSVGRKYVQIDFGELLGGRCRVPLRHITEVVVS